eukprot:scaffold50902_cov44-Prasinocladus_malaysianus.AAC.1
MTIKAALRDARCVGRLALVVHRVRKIAVGTAAPGKEVILVEIDECEVVVGEIVCVAAGP